MSTYLTAQEVCARLGVRRHIFGFAVKEYGPEPIRRAGLTRLWSEDQLPAIEASLAITAKRSSIRERRQAAGVSQ